MIRPAPYDTTPGKCQSVYVTASGVWGTDYVQCQKPAGHDSRENKRKSRVHIWTGRGGEVERWTEAEAER